MSAPSGTAVASHVADVYVGASRLWAGARVFSGDAAAWSGDTAAARNALGAAADWRAARALEDALADEAVLLAAYALAADAGAPAGELRETRALLAEAAARRSAAGSALGLCPHDPGPLPARAGLGAAPAAWVPCGGYVPTDTGACGGCDRGHGEHADADAASALSARGWAI